MKNSETNSLLKINKLGKGLHITAAIARIVFIIVAVLAILLTIVFAVAPESTVKIDFTSIANVTVNKSNADPIIYEQALTSSLDSKPISFAVGIVSIMVINTLVLIIFADKLFSSVMKCKSPLESSVITAFRRFSIYLIPWCFLDIILSALLKSVFTEKFSLSINPGTLVTIIIVVVISYAFKINDGFEILTEENEKKEQLSSEETNNV